MGLLQSILGIYPRTVRVELSDPASSVSVVLSGRAEVASAFEYDEDLDASDAHWVWPEELSQSDVDAVGVAFYWNPLIPREESTVTSPKLLEVPRIDVESETMTPMELLEGEPVTEIQARPRALRRELVRPQ